MGGGPSRPSRDVWFLYRYGGGRFQGLGALRNHHHGGPKEPAIQRVAFLQHVHHRYGHQDGMGCSRFDLLLAFHQLWNWHALKGKERVVFGDLSWCCTGKCQLSTGEAKTYSHHDEEAKWSEAYSRRRFFLVKNVKSTFAPLNTEN